MGVYGSPELEAGNNSSWEKNIIFCSKCGIKYSKKLKKCPQCGQKHAQPFYNKWWFWFLVVLVIFAFYSPSSDVENQNAKQAQPVMSEEEYKAMCEAVIYDDAERNPNNYVGEYAVFKGKVVQVMESGNNVTLRVNTLQNNHGTWEKPLYVDYRRKTENESRILEEDVIMIYGRMNGIKSYQSVRGDQISIPYLLAEYIETE